MTEQKDTSSKPDFAQVVQNQLIEFKQEFLQRLENLKAQFPLSQADLIELKDVLKTEFSAILEDVSSVSKEIKHDISEISVKHKDQLAETLKSSKEHVVDALNKINLSQPKDKPSEPSVES